MSSKTRSKSLFSALFPAPVAGSLVALGLLAAGLAMAPGSPATLLRADTAVGRGDVHTAVSLYDDVAANGWTTGLREVALRRAASLMAADLARPGEARRRLVALRDLQTAPGEVAALQERIAYLWLAERDTTAASRSFLDAYEASSRHPRAAERLTLAARCAAEAGESGRAAALWERLATEHPDQRSSARLAQARAALSQGDAQRALALFSEAGDSATSSEQRAASRLGVATSLERLGSLDEAIAELDSADLPGGVRDSRLDGLRARRDERGR